MAWLQGGYAMTVQSILDGKGNDVVSVGPETTLGELVAVLCGARVGAALVLDESGALIGIASERDVVRVLGRDGPGALETRVADTMTRAVTTCAPEDTIQSVMEKMTSGRFRHVPVVSGGRVLGVVSIGDVVKRRLNDLEFEADQLKQYITAG